MASLGTPPGLIRFGPFALDPISRELRKRGSLVKLQPQQFAVLLLLTERAGQIVSREEIHQRIWGSDTFVDFDSHYRLRRRAACRRRFQWRPHPRHRISRIQRCRYSELRGHSAGQRQE